MTSSPESRPALSRLLGRLAAGYATILKEVSFKTGNPSAMRPPASLLTAVLICAAIGLARNALEVAFGIRAGNARWYSFDADIVFAMLVWPSHLFLFGGAILHLFLRGVRARAVPASAILGVAFYAQALHLTVPPLDALGVAAGLSHRILLYAEPFQSNWYVSWFAMSLGIIVCWLLSAVVFLRVLVLRLDVSLRHVILAVAGTLIVLWIPGYLLWPAFNSIVEPVLGIVPPRKTLFWGYGIYLALTAGAGARYYLRHVNPSALRLPHRLLRLSRTATPARIHGWIFALSASRSIIDDFWHPGYTTVTHWVLTFFNTWIYLYLLYLAVPWLSVRFLRLLRVEAPDRLTRLLERTVTVWVAYPLVSLFSWMMDSPPQRPVGWFEHLPGFMADKTFLPAGMVLVIPFLIWSYGRHLRRLTGAPEWKSCLAATLALTTLYLLYYQYLLRLSYAISTRHGFFAFAGVYTLTFLVPLLPLARDFNRRLGGGRFFLPALVAAAAACVGLIVAGAAFDLDTSRRPEPRTSLDRRLADLAGQDARPRPQRPLRWELQLFVVPDYGAAPPAPLGYGYLLRVERSTPRFGLYLSDGSTFEDPAQLEIGPRYLAYGDVLELWKSEKRLLRYVWDPQRLAPDPFLSTFVGNDDVLGCRVAIRGEEHKCFMLDERIGADLAGKHLWRSETFFFLVSDAMTLLAFEYDGLADGALMSGAVRRRVSGVERDGERFEVRVSGGRVQCRCRILAPFGIYRVENGPRHSPLRCEVSIEIGDEAPTRTTAWGMLEFIEAPRRSTPRARDATAAPDPPTAPRRQPRR